ncbi:MAG TPA: NAD+ synthase [Candidatus Dormibacteraeota bacterium]|nr:NAD+ synthase [Candidatus Dormibacteraeota bacterium]
METSPRVLRIALGQLNPTVGDLEGNSRKVIDWVERARAEGADLVAFPELVLTGYPPEDLLLKPSFIRDNLRALEKVVAASRGIAVIVGFVDMDSDIYNAAAFAADGEVKGVYHKYYLPNYGVFDEERYFRRGDRCPIFIYQGVRIGVSICEDAWYPTGPVSLQALSGAELLVNINGSPYHHGKRETRETMIRTRAMDSRAFMAWVNTTGGQDELVFDGNSLMFGPEGQIIGRAPSFEEALLVGDFDIGSVFGERLHDTRLRREAQEPMKIEMSVSEVAVGGVLKRSRKWLRAPLADPLRGAAEVYSAVVVGTRDYLAKNGFAKAVLGLSGGVDSALTAAIAADALGPQNVIGVLMPSRYTSTENLGDGAACAEALGIQLVEIPIDPAHRAFEALLADAFRGTKPGIAEENIQPRIRGNILMALSNKFGYLLLTTGNKSELATGYCTLYGDMAGGFAVLKDIPKTLVYELCRYRNSIDGAAIPERILTKPPSAELRENQKDTDSLPPYEVLDPILRGYVEDDRSYEELVAAGHDPVIVSRVIHLVDRSEYKRRQAPPGVKITPRAFGRDRRMPLTNRYASTGGGISAAGRAVRPPRQPRKSTRA